MFGPHLHGTLDFPVTTLSTPPDNFQFTLSHQTWGPGGGQGPFLIHHPMPGLATLQALSCALNAGVLYLGLGGRSTQAREAGYAVCELPEGKAVSCSSLSPFPERDRACQGAQSSLLSK